MPPAGENRFPPDVEGTSGYVQAPITMCIAKRIGERQKEHGVQGPWVDGDESNCLPDCQLCTAGGTETYDPSGPS
jgi:hypothetical protein